MRTSKLNRALVISFLLLYPITACTSDDSPTKETMAQLNGQSYLLQSAVGYTPAGGSLIRLNFKGTELGFSGDCNSFSVTYSMSGNVLVLHGMSSTSMGCSADLMVQDDWLANFFDSRPSLTMDGNTLVLTSGNVVLTFLAREIADPDRALVGTKWTIESLITASAVSTVGSSFPKPTITFESDGTFAVETACNTGNGKYTATATGLSFSGVSFTSSTCTGSVTAVYFSQITALFADGDATYDIEAAMLTIMRGTVGMGARASK